MSKRVAIIQSNYIPWKGYFNIIKCVDEFVLLDDVQYTRRDWRNRNVIKTDNGVKWLTVPVDVKGQYYIKIKDVFATDDNWRKEHWGSITAAYRKTPHFSLYAPQFEELYLGDKERNLSQINFKFINLINSILNITTPIRWSMEFDAPEEKTERLVHICKMLGASEYVSGPAAKNYLNIDAFAEHKINVSWADYGGYPEYHQLHAPFEHGVSIIDLLFNEGKKADQFLKETV